MDDSKSEEPDAAASKKDQESEKVDITTGGEEIKDLPPLETEEGAERRQRETTGKGLKKCPRDK